MNGLNLPPSAAAAAAGRGRRSMSVYRDTAAALLHYMSIPQDEMRC